MNLVLPEIANNRKSSLIYLNNSNKKYIGPIVDIIIMNLVLPDITDNRKSTLIDLNNSVQKYYRTHC